MAFDDKRKRRIVAVSKKLKEDKGLVVKSSDLQKAIADYKQIQKDYQQVKEKYKDSEAVVKRADESTKKVQTIIDELNEYMRVLHPEGLLDMGTGSSGKAIVGHG